jgi:hypothetical protein
VVSVPGTSAADAEGPVDAVPVDDPAVDPDEQPEPASGSSLGGWSEQRFETIATILLAIAALATTWAGFQANLWGGIQSSNYSQAGALRVRSAEAFAEADQLRLADLSVFQGWLEATARGEEDIATFYRERFRPEFVPAFEAWVALEPVANADAPATPFLMPEYQLAADAAGADLAAQATAKFEDGEEANDISDTFVLATLLYASVLFFAAISERIETPRLRLTLLGIAAFAFVAGSVVMFSQPVTSGA